MAAYLYTLHLDRHALAWEYLRRHPDYVRDWWIRQRTGDGDPQRWGLRRFDDPAVDARDAQPNWWCDSHDTVQLHPDLDPSAGATRFRLWQLPGHKRLIHDGHRLRLTAKFAAGVLRLVLAPEIEDGMGVVGTVPIDEDRVLRWQAADQTLAMLDVSSAQIMPSAVRPRRSSIAHMRSLHALDSIQAGASMKQIAVSLFGARDVDARWHADSELRAQVRYLVRRGRSLMRGGYRHLLHPRLARKGRNRSPADTP